MDKSFFTNTTNHGMSNTNNFLALFMHYISAIFSRYFPIPEQTIKNRLHNWHQMHCYIDTPHTIAFVFAFHIPTAVCPINNKSSR